jgi:DNA-binding transcriptional ArsR family regulator
VHRGIDGFDMPAPDDVRRAADALRMLADPTRLNILWALMQGETSVACLAELADTSPTAVSQHLSKLRLAGLVANRREGTFVYYALADAHRPCRMPTTARDAGKPPSTWPRAVPQRRRSRRRTEPPTNAAIFGAHHTADPQPVARTGR